MPLLDERDMRMQIELHKYAYEQTWGPDPTYSHGLFPPETAFSERMIPALKAEGLDWVLVDNIHFDRATQNYPYTTASNLIPPNRADQINPDPAANGGAVGAVEQPVGAEQSQLRRSPTSPTTCSTWIPPRAT